MKPSPVTYSPQARALSLAYWLRLNTPALYMALTQAARGKPLGALGCACSRGMGALGQDDSDYIDMPDLTDDSAIPPNLTSNLPDASLSPPNFAFDVVDPTTLAPVTTTDITSLQAPAATIDTPPAGASTSSPIASAVGAAITSVASYLTTGGGLTNAMKLASTVVQANTAKTIAQAQIARVAAGYNPAAISYEVNPVTGQVQPVIASSAGTTVPLTGQALSTLAPGLSGNTWIFILIALGVLVALR